MSYQVLARKWRPRTFQQLVGQEHVQRALINALDNQRLHHNYLFTGTRGVGKTTLARILAKCLNCEEGIRSTPCGICPTCQDIDQGRFIDLIEIDAASRTKVEDTRELLDNVQYAPSQGRFKIYLIDEVHMLSGHSFNALLKILEEPPPHVKFILATTDPQRLPITVLSRCLQFHLKNLAPDLIAAQLKFILEQENITFDAASLPLIAHAADGSMRDALSLLDHIIGYCGGHITTVDVRELLGTVESTPLWEMIEALVTGNAKLIFDGIQHMAEHAVDFHRALEALISLFHAIAIAQIVPESSDALTEDKEKILHFSEKISREDLQLYYQIALIGRRDLPLAPHPRQGFEMILLRMLAFTPGKTSASTTPVEKKSTVTHTPVMPMKEIPAVSDEWSHLLSQLNLTGLSQTLAMHCTLKTRSDTQIDLLLENKHATLLNPKLQERIQQALTEHLKHPIHLTITPSVDTTNTPAQLNKRAHDQQQEAALQTLNNDPAVQALMKTFDAKIKPDSITIKDQ